MLSRLQKYASLIRFSHTVFALPFALTGALFANEQTGLLWDRVGWILLSMFLARTAAMGFNRIVDARFDALNPRTRTREIPQKKVSLLEASVIVLVSAIAFVAATYPLGELCFVLSPVALVIVFWYSLAKTFTHYTQLFLGLALAVDLLHGAAPEVILGRRDPDGGVDQAGEEDVVLGAGRVGRAVLARRVRDGVVVRACPAMYTQRHRRENSAQRDRPFASGRVHRSPHHCGACRTGRILPAPRVSQGDEGKGDGGRGGAL